VETNVPSDFIANLDEKCQGHGLKLSARADGSFEILNERNSFRRKYSGR
jgi:hypothetical protein